MTSRRIARIPRGSAACVIILAVAAAGPISPLHAQERRPDDTVQLVQAGMRTYNIPPQPLESALILFGQQAGRQVAADAVLLRGVSTGGVSGSMSVEEALRQLLAGTNLTYSGVAGATITLQRIGAPGSTGAMQLDPVQVQGIHAPPQAMIDNLPPPYAGDQVAKGGQVGMLGNRDFMDTPFNQSSYTSKLIENQQARGIADVADNDPSVRRLWSAESYETSSLMIRGFISNNNDLAFGGQYGIAPALSVTPEYLERVEILKGTSAMLNGMAPFGSIGGTVNIVPKRAPADALNQATINYASSGQVGGHLDFARRFGADDRIGVRFNAVYRNGSTAVDRQTQEIGAAVFGVDFRGEQLRLSLDYGYQKQRFNAPLRPTLVDPGVPVPATPGGRANWFQPWSYLDTSDLFGVAKAEFDLTPDWTVYASGGARGSRFDSLMGFAFISDSFGNLTDMPFAFASWTNVMTQEAGIRGRVDTGPIRHALVISGSHLSLDSGMGFPVVAAIQSNLYSPTFIAKPNVPTVNPPKTSSTELSSLAIADVMSIFDERIQFIVGGRYQRVQIGNYSNVTGFATSYYDQTAFSPAVGFIAKPWSNVSVYGNLIQGLQQGPTAPAGTQNAGETFPPAKSQQVELGAKVDLGNFGGTLSFFQIEQPFGVTNPTTGVFGVGGTQRNRGIELQIFGEPFSGFRPLGGVMLIDAVQLNTGVPSTEGLKATGVPDVSLNIGAEWDTTFLRGLTLSGRAIYTSQQYLDAANTQSIPSWVRFDAGVRYTFERAKGSPVALRLNVQNLFDANYWASANSSTGLANGAPRTFLLSLSTAF